MNNIQKLYIIVGFEVVVAMLPNNILATSSLAAKLILQIILISLAYQLILTDAKQRKLSASHAFWALLSPIGIVIYHLFFALRYKIKR